MARVRSPPNGKPVESVWDFPRPPVVERVDWRIRVVHGGVTIVDAPHAMRVLETSQAPAYYVAPDFVDLRHLVEVPRRSMCEWKGAAGYADVVVGERRASARRAGRIARRRRGSRRSATTGRSTPRPSTSAGSTTSESTATKAASTAAGSPPTSPARSRAPPARCSGECVGAYRSPRVQPTPDSSIRWIQKSLRTTAPIGSGP